MTTLMESENKLKILQWTEKLCRALEQQYRDQSLRTVIHTQAVTGTDPYLQERVRKIENHEDERISFFIEKGRKYYKICMRTKQVNRQFDDSISVHAFVDKNTGQVYKPASYNAPAKHVRYDLRVINDRAKLHDPEYTGWAGGYLYMR